MDNDIQDKLDRVRTKAGETVKRAGDTLKTGAERVSERARAASAGTGENLEKAKERARKTAGEANRIVTEHPLAAAAAAVAIGAVIAYAFPRGSRKMRSAAPKLLAAAGTASHKARKSLTHQAKTKLKGPADETEHFFDKIGDKIGDAARKAPASAADAARSGLESARSGLENARNFATETARRADIEERAGKFLDAAADIASKVAVKVREHSRKETGKD
ncbi:MAG: hypothetical protein AB7E05_05610 [Sphingobium sp.]